MTEINIRVTTTPPATVEVIADPSASVQEAIAAAEAAAISAGEADISATAAAASALAASNSATVAESAATAADASADASAASAAAAAAELNQALKIDQNLADLADAATARTNLGTNASNVPFTQAGTGATARTVGAKLSETVSVMDFGAVGDGVTDDTTAFSAALNSGASVVMLDPQSDFLIDADLVIPRGVTLDGGRAAPVFPGWNQSIDWSVLHGIILNSTASITLQGGAGLTGAFIKRKGMTLPAANALAFAGTAVKFSSRQDNQFVKNCFIVGFETAIFANDDRLGVTPQSSRYTIDTVWLDCTNGLSLDTSYDSCRVRDVHGWPFATIETYAAGGASDKTLIARSGTGVKITGPADDTQLDGVLMYGFFACYDFSGTGSINIGRIWADHPDKTVGSIGVFFGPGTTNVSIDKLWTWGMATHLDCAAGTGNIIDISTWHAEAGTNALTLTSGDISVQTMIVKDMSGVTGAINSSASKANIGLLRERAVAGNCINVASGSLLANINVGEWDTDRTGAATLFSVNSPAFTSVASVDPLVLPANGSVFSITGTTGFGGLFYGWSGRRVLLVFQGVLTVFDGASMNLAGNFVTTAGSTLELIYDGSQWKEISRSSN